MNNLWLNEFVAQLSNTFLLSMFVLSVLLSIILLVSLRLLANIKLLLAYIFLSTVISLVVVGADVSNRMREWRELDSYLPGVQDKIYTREREGPHVSFGTYYSYYNRIYFPVSDDPRTIMNKIYSLKNDYLDVNTLTGYIDTSSSAEQRIKQTSVKIQDFNFNQELGEGDKISTSLDCYNIRRYSSDTKMCTLSIKKQSGRLVGILAH